MDFNNNMATYLWSDSNVWVQHLCLLSVLKTSPTHVKNNILVSRRPCPACLLEGVSRSTGNSSGYNWAVPTAAQWWGAGMNRTGHSSNTSQMCSGDTTTSSVSSFSDAQARSQQLQVFQEFHLTPKVFYFSYRKISCECFCINYLNECMNAEIFLIWDSFSLT